MVMGSWDLTMGTGPNIKWCTTAGLKYEVYSLTSNVKLEPRSKCRFAPYIKQSPGVRAAIESCYLTSMKTKC